MGDEAMDPALTEEGWEGEEVSCPQCGGPAIEVTSTGDDERVYWCGDGCGTEWTGPFRQPDPQPGEDAGD